MAKKYRIRNIGPYIYFQDSGSPRFDEEFDFEIPFAKVQNHSLKFREPKIIKSAFI